MSSPSRDGLSSNTTNSNESLTIQKIKESLTGALSDLSKVNDRLTGALPDLSSVKHSIPKPTPENNHHNSENNENSESKNIHSNTPENHTTTTTGNGDNIENGSSNNIKKFSLDSQHLPQYGQLEKLQRDLGYVRDAFDKLKKFEDHVSHPIKAVLHRVDKIVKTVDESSPESFFLDNNVRIALTDLNGIVKKLKVLVPSLQKISTTSSDVRRYWTHDHSSTGNGADALHVFDKLPDLHMNESFRSSYAYKDFQVLYDSLDRTRKLCLLCFALFPENAVVKKRLLIYWWVGEGLLVSSSGSEEPGAVEKSAEDIFEELMVKGFIEPINKKRGLVPDSFKMQSFIRSAIIMFAQEAGFFDFDRKGNPTANFLPSCRACLSEEGSSLQLSAKSDLNQEQLHTLFNVGEPYLNFTLDWFSKMKNVNVLQLGRWQSLAKRRIEVKHHIEVENTEFLKGLRNMKHLKFFSLQGISRIMELPDSICRLTNLRILDLRACHNLEVLPDGIGSLKNLTHLDMSECYLLDRMPKGLELLSELEVLKGFVIGDPKSRSPCTLNDLVNLKKLRKLSINTGWKAFPTDKELTAFQQFKALRKLTIAWGGVSLQAKPDNSAKQDNVTVKSKETGTTNLDNRGDMSKQDIVAAEPATPPAAKKAGIRKTFSRLGTLNLKQHKVTYHASPTLPTELEKLDLQCFPQRTTPNWLMPGTLKNLKKLYIRGGKLRGLGQVQEAKDRWAVETLRLKFLCELKMDWRELCLLFPKLIYLEKVKCPNLIFFPCDESGVWLNENSGTI
ncbi:hypothetical protein L1049_010193 [Liquidambar formosana]|uniref:Disease resistance RPP13-like protein 4 n=1 Tax=Liquidambar formosana TaxID=63359 RepID=A0AAP0NAM3_LIQFO